jgi:ribonuclease P protein component
MRNETHVPTEQNPPKENPRLPRPNENCRRTQGDQTPPPGRPQDFGPLNRKKFPKGCRLLKRPDFQRVMRNSQRLVGTVICIDWSISFFKETRLGITASKRYGDAPERNRFKRLVREAFRLARSELPAGFDLNISPRQKAKNATLAMIRGELLSLLLPQNAESAKC